MLRYWEREFSQLRPQKNRAGNRVYTRRDLSILKVIKRLLRQERYTVAGAKEFLRQHDIDEVLPHAERLHDEHVDATLEEAAAEDALAVSERKAKDARTLIDELTTTAASLRRTASAM